MGAREALYLFIISAVVASPPGRAVAGRHIFHVGDVRVIGNRHVRTEVIRREIPFQRGDVYDPAKLEAAQERIAGLPGIDYSDIRVDYVAADSTLRLTAIVTEKSALSGQILLQRGYENDMSFGLRIAERNLRGRSELLSGAFLLRGNRMVRAHWQDPWIATRHRIGVGVRGWYAGYDYVYHDLGDSLSGAGVDRAGGEVRVFWSRGGPSRVFASAGFESVDGGRDGVTNEPGGDRYATLGLGGRFDRRDSVTFPWSGGMVRASAREIGPGDPAFSILETSANASAFVSVVGRVVVGAAAAFVWRDGARIPAYRREHLGGSRTLRGYDFGSFHGINSLVGSAELRVPVNFSRHEPVEDVLLGIEVHAFVDGGAAWERGEDVTSDLFHTTYGIGLALLNRQIPGLRIDHGWHRGSKGRWEIDVGMKF